MEDKRLVTRITRYWESLRKKTPLPVWNQFKPDAMDDDIWPRCCAWRVDIGEDTNPYYSYEHVGEEVKLLLGGIEPTGIMRDEHFRHFPGARVIQKMTQLMENKYPLLDSVNFITEKNEIIKCRTCLLPFGDKKGQVTHIVLAVSARAFE